MPSLRLSLAAFPAPLSFPVLKGKGFGGQHYLLDKHVPLLHFLTQSCSLFRVEHTFSSAVKLSNTRVDVLSHLN